MKNIWVLILLIIVIIGGGVLEQTWLNNNFDTLNKKSQQLLEKCENETITSQDLKSFEDWWTTNKKTLHIFIKHDDIKEVDYWFSEGKNYAENKHYELAKAQFAIICDSAATFSSSYRFSIENIF